MSINKPVIVLVGGAWHTVDYLMPLAAPFHDKGYETRALALPSAGANPPHTDFSVDVAAVRQAVEAVIAVGRDAVVVLHSFAGIPGTEAMHGLGKKPGNGDEPGVLAIVYIASQLPAKGNNFGAHMVSLGDPTWDQARAAFTKDGAILFPKEFNKSLIYSDIDEKEADHWLSFLMPQSVGPYDSPLTHDTYNEIPSGYIACKKDLGHKYALQAQTVIDRGFPEDRVLHIDTGHVAWLTQPAEVCDFVLKIASGAASK